MIETPELVPRGCYRDVLLGADGKPLWDRGWHANAIVADCRRLIAGALRGAPTTVSAIEGLLVGAGADAWDASAPPAPNGTETRLVDPNPYLAQGASVQIDFLEGGTVVAVPSNRLQIKVTLGPNLPNWPDPNHVTGNLREFGLAASLNGQRVLLNYVTHPVIAKDPASTLERTIWLVF